MEIQNKASGLTGHQKAAENTVFAILIAISFSHMLNDTIQSLIPAIYPILKNTFQLTFTQVGLITLTFQLTASLLQPFVGLYTDHRPKPYSLAIGMGLTLCGLLLLSRASNFPTILCSAGLVGMGSSIFHPQASRLARMASGGRHGVAQSIFQVGGNAGTSLGPLLAALIIVPRGQGSIGWFSLVALVAIMVLTNVGGWYKRNLFRIQSGSHAKGQAGRVVLSPRRVILSLAVLIVLIFSKFFYLSCLTSYFNFYLFGTFHFCL
jgi:FSR family fosmidomycin resistance protein-like MFS transporter